MTDNIMVLAGRAVVIATALAVLAGCASTDSQTATKAERERLAALANKQLLPKKPLSELTGQYSGRTPASEAVFQALSQLGKPYRWGGDDRNGFDCSGLTQYVYRKTNIDLPRTAAEQYQVTKRIADEERQPGDLLFFRQNGNRIDHVAIYLGNGEFIHAPNSDRNVERDTLDHVYWGQHYVGAGRVQGQQTGH